MKHYIERDGEPQEIKYPCLMESKVNPGLIVRFTERGIGTVIAETGEQTLFRCSTTWAMEERFKPFHGKVIFES